MPAPVTRIALRVLQSERYWPIELLDVRLAGASTGSIIRLNNSGESVTFGGNTYIAMAMTRTEIERQVSTEAGQKPSVTVAISNIDSQMAELLNQVQLEGAAATLYQTDRRLLLKYPSRTRDALLLIKGEIRNPVLDQKNLVFQIIGILAILDEIRVPRRIFQPQCNATFGSPSCGANANVSPNTITTTCISGTNARYIRVSNSVITEAGNPADPTDYWKSGEMVLVDGPAATQFSPIQRVVVGGGERRFYLRQQLLVSPNAGDTVLIRRGCGKTKADCQARQGHVLNFQGYEEVPHSEFRPDIKGGIDL